MSEKTNGNNGAALPRACLKVLEAARSAGLDVEIRLMAESTRSAEEAAVACGTVPARIVKSLVFAGKQSGKPILLLVSGANRVKENLVAKSIGEKVTRPDASFVREVTGFAIGGIPPFGHGEAIETWLDEDLLKHDTVFAAAGTPNAIFEVPPHALQSACGAQVIAVHD